MAPGYGIHASIPLKSECISSLDIHLRLIIKMKIQQINNKCWDPVERIFG
jgi:hypothetical protein